MAIFIRHLKFRVPLHLHQLRVQVYGLDHLIRQIRHQSFFLVDTVGLPFDERVLSWPAEMPAQWTKWPGWHDEAAKSTGFVPPKRAGAAHGAEAPPPLPEHAKKAVDLAQPIYDRLYALCTR